MHRCHNIGRVEDNIVQSILSQTSFSNGEAAALWRFVNILVHIRITQIYGPTLWPQKVSILDVLLNNGQVTLIWTGNIHKARPMYSLIRLCGFRQYSCARLAALLPLVYGDLLPASPPSRLRLPSAPITHLLLRFAARRFRLHHQPPHLSRSRLTCCFNPLAPGGCCRSLTNMSQTHVWSSTCVLSSPKQFKPDGGLSFIGQGTFGWMLTDAKGTPLVTDSGPVDGSATHSLSSMALPRHWNTSINFHATTRCDLKASTSGNVTVNVRLLEPTFCSNSNNGGDNHTMLISFPIWR